MISKWITSGWTEFPMVLLSCLLIYSLILLYTRLAGLRSFSKMSSADFAMTVAVGSLFGSTISGPNPSVVMGAIALASLFAGQWLLALLRRRSSVVNQAIDNQPILLMHGKTILEDNLKLANVTRNDLFAKLREANALNYDHVLAVVFETTGDVSVLHSNDPEAKLEPDFLQEIRGAERLFNS
ncbi:hypothetical protein Pla110_17250 [Polystyrenella longa]|uniref:YetF C-terminal domain-containing protein n=1 Tax=Polystyrenella longa TaxID=2528007 RepID=A0A518CL99_9PLAN|nr:YetF domain-containing protein [Polystyrenella longa]QDU80003.1 hypothetical protein Pla110_17250 [Polystyrenella longa]